MENLELAVTGRNEYTQGDQDVTDITLTVVNGSDVPPAPGAAIDPKAPTRTVSGSIVVRYTGDHPDLKTLTRRNKVGYGRKKDAAAAPATNNTPASK